MTGPRARARRLFAPPPPTSRLIDRFAGPLDEPLRLLFEDPSAGRVVADEQGRVVRTSGPLQLMLGTALELSPGTQLRLLFVEADRESAWSEIAAVLRGRDGAVAGPLIVQLVGDTAEPLIASMTCLPLAGAGDAVEGVLLSIHDVSLLSRLEAQLAQSQPLQEAGQLAGGIAHDFNNLLAAILGGADAIAGRGGLGEATLEDLEAIRASAGRAAALVRYLLAFGRPQTAQPQVLALSAAVSEIAGVLRRLLVGGVRLEFALDQPGGLVWIDPTALDRVLVNLVANARDAMPRGGTLTLRTGELTVSHELPGHPETIPPGSYAVLEVRDTGVGIPADVLRHIFEPRFTTRLKAGGTGLGLSTVHGIVRQSGGFLAVESTPGQGTRMRVYLPAWRGVGAEAASGGATAEPAACGPEAPAQRNFSFPESRRSRGAVLLVDDEDVLRRAAERALAREGWRVLAAPTAEAALQLLDAAATVPLVAVVSDLVLPGMDGAALLQAVRDRLGRPRLPGVLVSGYGAEELRDRIAAVPGAAEPRILGKPYEMQELTAVLAEICA